MQVEARAKTGKSVILHNGKVEKTFSIDILKNLSQLPSTYHLLGPDQDTRSPILFVRPELARVVCKSEDFVFLIRTE